MELDGMREEKEGEERRKREEYIREEVRRMNTFVVDSNGKKARER